MQVRVNQSANAVYVNLTDAAIIDSEQVADGIVVDYDAEGRGELLVQYGDRMQISISK